MFLLILLYLHFFLYISTETKKTNNMRTKSKKNTGLTENQRLKIIRKKMGFTQAEFASSLGIKQGSYSDIERGKVGISGVMVKALITKYRINPIWLYQGLGQEMMPELNEEPAGDNYDAITLGICKHCDDYKKIIDAHQKTIKVQNEYIAELKGILEKVSANKNK